MRIIIEPEGHVNVCFQQFDLETIKEMYLEKYDVPLKEALSSECGGDFKRLLLEILH